MAKLIAADDSLHPRLRIIADERLTGASREKVEARLNLWLKTHIEKLLGPLFDLSKAEDVTGIARGIAFQLVEALGVIERARIAAEMKDLDQPSRATLRKYGVRFGAYHIYFPNLLKPAARALAALLWAIKQDNVDLSALAGAQQLAGSGRTSFPVDKTLPRDAYRMLGYRQCGERAVRVDILERLADLIRPALSWREAAPGAKPPGAFDGRGFVVTQAMTSLTGSAGEDFASILRALGYRMERRPPLPPKPVVVEAPTEAASEAPVEASTEVPAEAVAEGAAEIVEQPVSGDPAPSAALLPEVTPLAAAEETPAIVEAPTEPAAEAAPEPVATEATAESVAPAAEAPAETAVTEATPEAATETPATAETPAEPQLVDVWRPGGRNEDRRPRHERHRRHHGPRKEGEQAAAAPGEAAAGEAGAGEKREGEKRHRHRRGRDFRKGREQVAPAAEGAAVTATASPPATEGATAAAPEQRRHEPRGDRRERFEGKGQDRDKDRDKNRDNKDRDNKREKFGDRQGARRDERDQRGRDKGRDKRDRESGPALRHYATSAAPRDRAADPNSPFAKLAALKDQLAGNRKD